MPFEITVAKIKLTLGRNYHNTFHHSILTGRKCLRGTGGAQNGAVHPKRDQHVRPRGGSLSGSSSLRPTTPKMLQRPFPSERSRSPRSSSKSKLLSAFLSSFLNQSREEELSSWAKKRQALFCHLPGWVFSLPSPPTSGLRQTSSKPGDSTPSLAGLLSRQQEGTALPLGPTGLPLFWQRFVLT